MEHCNNKVYYMLLVNDVTQELWDSSLESPTVDSKGRETYRYSLNKDKILLKFPCGTIPVGLEAQQSYNHEEIRVIMNSSEWTELNINKPESLPEDIGLMKG